MVEVKKACVHVSYVESLMKNGNDMCLIKERHFLPDGTQRPGMRLVKNAKRSWFLTIPEKQNHKSKKEWEKKNYTQEFKINQARLTRQMAEVLHCRPSSLRRMNRSPYVYGTDVHVTSIIKDSYDKKGDEVSSVFLPTSGFADYEWDIDTQHLSFGAYVFEEQVYLVVREDKVRMIPNFAFEYHEMFDNVYLPWLHEWNNTRPKKDQVTLRDYKLTVLTAKNPVDVAKVLYGQVHKDKPDYLAYWNGSADMDTMMANCDEYGVNPADIFVDPVLNIPDEFKVVKYNKDNPNKLDANGNPKNVPYNELWNTVDVLSSFQFIDLMAIYSANRVHLSNKPSYSLDYTLQAEMGLSKFKFKGESKELDEMEIADWHTYMSNNKPIEYGIYAIGDVIPMQLLADAFGDITGQLYPKLGKSPLSNFKKNPRRLCDSMHFELLERGYVVGSTSDQLREDLDDNVYPCSNWIVTLNSDLPWGMGTYCLEDVPSQLTSFVPKVGDGDITSSYPSTTRFLNMSKATTYGELFKIDGLTQMEGRELGMDISAGGGAAMSVMTKAYNYPDFQEMAYRYVNKKVVAEV